MTNDANTRKFGRMKCATMLSALALAVPITFAAGQTASADCSFYKGKTVELIVPFNPGGGFDTYGRLVAKHLAGKLGAENVIVRNQPGAGGLLATNKTWTAEPDGLLVQMMSVSGMITSELGGAAGVGFETAGFSWIGRISGEPDVVTIGPDSEIDGVDDIKSISAERQVRIGSSGVGDIDYVEAELLTTMFGLNSNIITGFSGAPEVYTSMARGELDLFTSSLSAAVSASKAGSAKILWVFGEPIESMPDVKRMSEVVDAEFVPLVEAHNGVLAVGRSLAGPPGIPAERLECLRTAFDEALSSEALLKESEDLGRPVAPLSGAEVARIIDNVMTNAPETYRALLNKTFGG